MLALLCTGLDPEARQTVGERLVEAPPERQPGTAFQQHMAQVMRGGGPVLADVVGR